LRTVLWAGTKVRTLAPENLVLFLCAHGAKHLWERLGWLCDFAQLLKIDEGIDWNQGIRQSQRTDPARILSPGLLRASKITGVTLPPVAAAHAATDRTARALTAIVLERLPYRASLGSPANDSLLFTMRAFERTGHRLRPIIGVVFEPTEAEYQALQLPPGL